LGLQEGDALQLDMDDVIHISETSLTIRGSRRRTTIPVEVVEHLNLKDGDKIRWILMKDCSINVTPVKKAGQSSKK
jgi:bifunctional DNA-binding transcriptional regulator/antitoxin component of YhaV-PrlF toxin-antitoxin module